MRLVTGRNNVEDIKEYEWVRISESECFITSIMFMHNCCLVREIAYGRNGRLSTSIISIDRFPAAYIQDFLEKGEGVKK